MMNKVIAIFVVCSLSVLSCAANTKSGCFDLSDSGTQEIEFCDVLEAEDLSSDESAMDARGQIFIIKEIASKTQGQLSDYVSERDSITKFKLADYLSYTTVQICSVLGNGRVRYGTGFFYQFRLENSDKVIPVIVSNRHVVKGSRGAILRFTTISDGCLDKIIEYRLQYRNTNWLFHPTNNVDLAFLPMEPVFRDIRNQLGTPALNYQFSSEMIPSPNRFDEIMQMEDAHMIGYPDRISDRVNNQPIFRKGSLATRPNKDYQGKREFLINMPVYNGSSGSPVVRQSRESISGGYIDRPELIGIVRSTCQHSATGVVKVAVDESGRVSVTNHVVSVLIPNDLGVVIHASRLNEMEKWIQNAHNKFDEYMRHVREIEQMHKAEERK